MPQLPDSESPTTDLCTRGLVLREMRESSREADFIASTDDVDAYGDVVEQSWILGRFLSNPVILFAHRSRELPIGKATRCEVVNGQLECTIAFASEKANPLAEQVWQSVREKTLRAVSVGFNPRSVRVEKRDGKDVYVLADNELFEISVTPIPANPHALSKMRSKMRAKAREAAADSRKDIPMNEIETLRVALADKEKLLSAKDEALTSHTKELEGLRARALALETEAAALRKEKAAADEAKAKAEARAQAAEDAQLGMEIDAYVGKGIDPVERDEALFLAKANPELWAAKKKRLDALRPEQKLVGTRALPDAPSGDRPATGGLGNAEGEDMALEAQRLGEAARR